MDVFAVSKFKRYRLRALVLSLLLLLWFGGGLGFALRRGALALAPRESKHHRVIEYGAGVCVEPGTGAVIRVSSRRLHSLAREALGWKAYLIPPGFFPRNYIAELELLVRVNEEAEAIWMPVVVCIDPEAPNPRVRMNLPSDLVNRALAYEGSFTQREKRKKYALGHYTRILSLTFDKGELSSVIPERQRDRAVTFRRIEGYASGLVRFRIDESLMNMRTKAEVRRMDMRCDLDFRKYVDGISLSYKITIPKLDANIKNLAPIFEKRPVELLRSSLEDSISRPRNLERLSRKRLPLWLPIDTDIEVRIFESD